MYEQMKRDFYIAQQQQKVHTIQRMFTALVAATVVATAVATTTAAVTTTVTSTTITTTTSTTTTTAGSCCQSTGSASLGGDVAIDVFDRNQPSSPTPLYSVLVSISVFMVLSTVFHSLNYPDNSLLFHYVLPF